jgi:hypothetical protein
MRSSAGIIIVMVSFLAVLADISTTVMAMALFPGMVVESNPNYAKIIEQGGFFAAFVASALVFMIYWLISILSVAGLRLFPSTRQEAVAIGFIPLMALAWAHFLGAANNVWVILSMTG